MREYKHAYCSGLGYSASALPAVYRVNLSLELSPFLQGSLIVFIEVSHSLLQGQENCPFKHFCKVYKTWLSFCWHFQVLFHPFLNETILLRSHASPRKQVSEKEKPPKHISYVRVHTLCFSVDNLYPRASTCATLPTKYTSYSQAVIS